MCVGDHRRPREIGEWIGLDPLGDREGGSSGFFSAGTLPILMTGLLCAGSALEWSLINRDRLLC